MVTPSTLRVDPVRITFPVPVTMLMGLRGLGVLSWRTLRVDWAMLMFDEVTVGATLMAELVVEPEKVVDAMVRAALVMAMVPPIGSIPIIAAEEKKKKKC